jgi:hypothetical protein
VTGPRLKAELQVALMTTDKPRVLHIAFECENSAAIFKQMFTGAVMFRAGSDGVVLKPDFFSDEMLDEMWNLLMRKLEEEEVERLLREASQSDG